MKVTVLSNIPSPYRVDFFNQLGKYVKLKVIFEARRARGIKFNWNDDVITNFEAVYLKNNFIEESRFNFKILKYINMSNQDFMIVTNYSYYTELLGLLYIKLKKIPYILEVDGGFIKTENIAKKVLKHILISNADLYLSPSSKSDDYLIYYGAEKRKIYRYPFTSLREEDILKHVLMADEKALIRRKLNIKEDKIILSVGQFIYRKGFDILLRSVANIDGNIGIYIVGGTSNKEYDKLIKNLNISNVHFLKFMNKDELMRYYDMADLFVLPTREDIWGLVINEAMARGLPIISTDKCVAALELVRDGINGFIVQSEDVSNLKNKITVILNNDDLK